MDKNNKNIRVLMVDDFDTMRTVIRNILFELGFVDIVEAKNGSEASKILKSKKIDLIISDWNMPKMTGYDLLKFVRSDPEIKDTPFIMVTAEADKGNIILAVKSDVSQYIIKPFTAETLGEKIKFALQKKILHSSSSKCTTTTD